MRPPTTGRAPAAPPPVSNVSPSGARTRMPTGLSRRAAAAVREVAEMGSNTLSSTNWSTDVRRAPPPMQVALSGAAPAAVCALISSARSGSRSLTVTSWHGVAKIASAPLCSSTSPLAGSRKTKSLRTSSVLRVRFERAPSVRHISSASTWATTRPAPSETRVPVPYQTDVPSRAARSRVSAPKSSRLHARRRATRDARIPALVRKRGVPKGQGGSVWRKRW